MTAWYLLPTSRRLRAEIFSQLTLAGSMTLAPRLSAAHRIEKIRVILGCSYLIQQEFRRFQFVHRVEELAQHPDLLQDVLLDEQLLAACTRLVDVDRREDALLVHAPVEVGLHVAGALEFLVDHVVHAAAGVDQRGGEDS